MLNTLLSPGQRLGKTSHTVGQMQLQGLGPAQHFYPMHLLQGLAGPHRGGSGFDKTPSLQKLCFDYF